MDNARLITVSENRMQELRVTLLTEYLPCPSCGHSVRPENDRLPVHGAPDALCLVGA